MSEELVCRTCLTNNIPLISVFEIRKINGEIMSISSMLNYFTNIEISLDDVLPTSICKMCLTEIQQAYIFREKCIKSNKFLEDKYMKPPSYDDHDPGGNQSANVFENFNQLNQAANNLFKLSNPRTISNENSHTSHIIEQQHNQSHHHLGGSPEFIDISSLNKQINLALSNSSINNGLRMDSIHNPEHIKSDYMSSILQHNSIETPEDKYITDLNISANLKPMPCDICGKLFYNYFSLKKHFKLHTGERRYKCDLCPKAFFQSSCLKRHIDTHSTIKKFPCHVCGVGLSRKDHLRRHMERLHSIHRVFKCSICGKCYSTVLDLRRHTDSHTYGKRFTCPICGIGISRKDHLKRHINNKHKAEADQITDLNQYAHPAMPNMNNSRIYISQPPEIKPINLPVKQEPDTIEYDNGNDSDVQIYSDIVKEEPHDLTDSPEMKNYSISDDEDYNDDENDDDNSRLSPYSYQKEQDLKHFPNNPYYNFVLNENSFFRKDLTIK